ncbi:MAG: 3'-5' exonuclease, partial [Nioella sp.]
MTPVSRQLPIRTPEVAEPRYFTDAAEAVAHLQALYAQAIDYLQARFAFKSKGLEYPVVALPFLCTYREVDARFGSPLYHIDHRPVLELAAKKDLAPEGFQRADDERLSEEVRLLYVALTRARHATFIGLAPLAVGASKTATLHKSALGYLLAGGEKIPDLQSLRACWRAQV